MDSCVVRDLRWQMDYVMNRFSRWWILLLFGGTLQLAGCMFRSRPVPVRMSTTPLQTATCDELIDRVNSQASEIRTLKAVVGIATSVGGSRRGKVTDYHEIRGYILASKPSLLRMTGLLPVLEDRMFDMVSSGHEFRLWIPSRNQFIVGNDQVTVSPEPVENLRPQVIYDTLLLQPIDSQDDVIVMEQGNQTIVDPKTRKPEFQPDYTLDVIRRTDHGWYLSRKTFFDRTDLQPREQIIYDRNGSIETDAHYEQFNIFNGFRSPPGLRSGAHRRSIRSHSPSSG